MLTRQRNVPGRRNGAARERSGKDCCGLTNAPERRLPWVVAQSNCSEERPDLGVLMSPSPPCRERQKLPRALHEGAAWHWRNQVEEKEEIGPLWPCVTINM